MKMWAQHLDFIELVKDVWKDHILGCPNVCLKAEIEVSKIQA